MDQKLYGPPGAGKTRRLVEIAEGAVRERGPDRLGALTFTRSAAQELKQRLGGGNVPAVLADRVFPNVGTIHSLCYRLIGKPKVLTNAQKRAWARELGEDVSFHGPENPEYADVFELREPAEPSFIAQVIQEYSGARQRCEDPLKQAGERARKLIASYEDYKRQHHVIDFEDMLEQGMREALDVDDLLVDEAQDNSKLLWKVINAWRRYIPRTISAGDPWQSIFRFSGGDPDLFLSQPGDWETIDDSHRLDQPSAEYARRILRAGGQDHPLLRTWDGVGGIGRDGTEFYLARTRRLVDQIADDLMEQGVPFDFLSSKKGLLGADATLPYRAGQELHRDGSLQAYQLAIFVGSLRRGNLHPTEVKRIESLARADPEKRVYAADLYWADHIRAFADHLPNAGYYRAIVHAHGQAALVLPPRIKVGTIHSAKGREADRVHLVSCWGSLPGRAALGREVGEVCVAYVGSSRHRQSLDLLYVDQPYGVDYPWPARYAVVNT